MKKETMPEKRNRLLEMADGIVELLGPHLLASHGDHLPSEPQQSLYDSEGCYFEGER